MVSAWCRAPTEKTPAPHGSVVILVSQPSENAASPWGLIRAIHLLRGGCASKRVGEGVKHAAAAPPALTAFPIALTNGNRHGKLERMVLDARRRRDDRDKS